jgi:hypothetical protein
MKNLKMSLTAVAVLAVVGSALAFKAHRSSFAVYGPDSPGSTNCNTFIGNGDNGNAVTAPVSLGSPGTCITQSYKPEE